MNNILDVTDLKVYFPIHGGIFLRKQGEVKAVDGISFTLGQGEILGLVGESGCGKTTVGKALINVVPLTSGKVLFDPGKGEAVDLAQFNRRTMRPWRSEIQMVFQDPYSSLNSRMSASAIIEEPLTIHCKEMSPDERLDKVSWLLEKVGLHKVQGNNYPHEFSGGQRQRIGIARALATNPSLVIADEPVSALDVSIQAQVINLLKDIQEEFKLSYIFIAHDLSVVEHISDRIAVMYLGNIVEIGPSQEVHKNPAHPYTRALLSAVPLPDPHRKRKRGAVLTGEVPSPLNKPSGCGFRTRCPIAKPDCAEKVPDFRDMGNQHFAACPYS